MNSNVFYEFEKINTIHGHAKAIAKNTKHIVNVPYTKLKILRKTLERMLEVLGEIESDLEKRQIEARQPKKTSETFKP